MTGMLCAAHEAVAEAASREAVMVVGGFSLCESCGGDAVYQVVEESKYRHDVGRGRSPEQVVADEIARCVERGFL
jgi:hypothetical protein